MAPFYPVYVRRSDGRVTIQKTSSTKETNEPLPEQLITKPNSQGISDYYPECVQGETKEVDWRRKLAGMLVREIGGPDTKDKNYILAALPENYRLFEHVRCKVSETDEKPQKVTKNHAAGSNERQDAYLYGHPQGRKKRYRSPAEFFPHLLWLCTDADGDPNNCSCKFCSPEELESEDKPPKSSTKEAKQQAQNPPVEPQPKSSGKSNQDKHAPVRRPSQQGIAATESHEPSPLPRPRREEQKIDAKYGEYLYRLGELVWFQRGHAWGLGVVVQRDIEQTLSQVRRYQVQPLSHPLSHPPSVICQQEQLRAWLAWSPPPCISPELNSSATHRPRPPTYTTVDWQAYLNGAYGPGDPEVDGSILAAKMVDTTYTLFDIIESKTSTSNTSQTSEIHYNGIYLGGEKLWLGDPLRLRSSSNSTDLFVVLAIVERPNPTEPSRSDLTFVGDIYTQRIAQSESDTAAVKDDLIPPRMRDDIQARNSITMRAPDPSRRYACFWSLQSKAVKINITDVKGRWYESSLLMPILSPRDYDEDRQKGEIGDAGLWMNGQGDCNKPLDAARGEFKPAEVKTKKREDAFNGSVPPNFRISKGLDETGRKPTPESNIKFEQYPAAHGMSDKYNDQSTIQGSHQRLPPHPPPQWKTDLEPPPPSRILESQREPDPVSNVAKQEQHDQGLAKVEPISGHSLSEFRSPAHNNVNPYDDGSRARQAVQHTKDSSMSENAFDQYMEFNSGQEGHDGQLQGFGQQYDSQGFPQGFAHESMEH